MNIGRHFTLEELTHSDTAMRKGIDNTPPEFVVHNLSVLVEHVLDPLRDLVGKPIVISSGYRSPQLNELIGGANGSQHVKGQAADIIVTGMTVEELFLLIKKSNLNIKYDQVIQEFDRWVHVSFNPILIERGEALRGVKVNGLTEYQKA